MMTMKFAHVLDSKKKTLKRQNWFQLEWGSSGGITVCSHLPVSLESQLLYLCFCFLASAQQRVWVTSAGTSPDCQALPLHYNELALKINLLPHVHAISSI